MKFSPRLQRAARAARAEPHRRSLLKRLKDRIVGPHARLAFTDDIPCDAAALRRSGGAPGSKPFGGYRPRIILLSTRAGIETLVHEATHLFQHLGAFRPWELALLAHERRRNRRSVVLAYAMHWRARRGLTDEEIDAYAAGLHAAEAELALAPPCPRSALERTWRRLLNWLRGFGYAVSEDVFEAQRLGVMRARLDAAAARQIRPGVGLGPFWEWRHRRRANRAV